MGLVVVGIALVWVLYGTDLGEDIRQRDALRRWTVNDPLLSRFTFLVTYFIVGLFALPVWWLQLLAGHCFGLVMGVVWCHVGAMAAAWASVQLAQWLMGDWIEGHLGRHRERFHAICRKLGHNGLLVVTATRVSHVMPFGISNYLFGLTRLRMVDVLVGTVLGGTLSKMLHVAAGSDPRMLYAPWFLASLVVVNALLLSPLLLQRLLPRRTAADEATGDSAALAPAFAGEEADAAECS